MIKLYAVEYRTNKDNATFEIFDHLSEAQEFADSFDMNEAYYIFSAYFDVNSIYREKDRHWNYDDNSALYQDKKIIKCLICNR